jgi:hypothetical protein
MQELKIAISLKMGCIYFWFSILAKDRQYLFLELAG